MPAPNFQQQLMQDLRKSAPKTAVLVLLLLVGLYFWIPPLLKAFASEGSSTQTPSPVVAVSTSPATPSGSLPTSNDKTTVQKTEHDSAAIAQSLKECRALQSAKIDELPEKPFTLNLDQFPIPVLVSDEVESVPAPMAAIEVAKPADTLHGLMLKSTIVGSQQRAAWINNRLYREGHSVPWNGQTLRLSSISRKSVTLTDGTNEWQLTLQESAFDVGSSNTTTTSTTRDEKSRTP